jgi:DNA polymerase
MYDSVAASALDWWAEAGIDALAEDMPRNWLAVTAAAEPAHVETKPATIALPGTLETFRAWLLSDPSVPGGANGRIDAMGDAASGIAIVVDMPEPEDRLAGGLLSGEVGALFDRMLGAIQLGRDSIYLIPFSPVRATSGRLGAAELAALAPLLVHHLTLVAPKKLLLLGDAPVQALLDRPAARAREAVHAVPIGAVDVPTVASLHPRLVHLKRDYRALAWDDLQRFAAL